MRESLANNGRQASISWAVPTVERKSFFIALSRPGQHKRPSLSLFKAGNPSKFKQAREYNGSRNISNILKEMLRAVFQHRLNNIMLENK